MNSASRGLWPVSRPTPTWKSTFCVGGGRRLARSALRGRFQSAPRPSADDRPAPIGRRSFCVGGGRRLARSALGGRFQSAPRPLADGRPAPTGRRSFCVGGGRRLARSAWGGRFQLASKAFGRWVGLRRPGKAPFASAEADAWRRAFERLGAKAFGRFQSAPKAFGRRSACADRESVLCVGGGRRLARSALRGRFQSAQGLRPVGRSCTPNEFGLQGPSADGRPAPTGKAFFASAEADAWRAAPEEADFNRRQGLRPVGRPAPTGRRSFCVGGGRRPARSALRGRFQSAFKADAWRGAPLKADFNRHPGGAPDSPFSRPL
jgi:hypothetical protein